MEVEASQPRCYGREGGKAWEMDLQQTARKRCTVRHWAVLLQPTGSVGHTEEAVKPALGTRCLLGSLSGGFFTQVTNPAGQDSD